MDKIKSLVERLRKGEQVHNELILLLMPIAYRTARRYIAFNRVRIEDIMASSLHGLVQAVNWAKERLYDDNIEGYVVETCKRFIRDFLENDHLIPVDRKAMERGSMPPVIHSISLRYTGETGDPGLPGHNVQPRESEGLEYQEVIMTLSLTDKEFKTVVLRLKGHTVKEIGRLMGYTDHTYIVRILQKVASKWTTNSD